MKKRLNLLARILIAVFVTTSAIIFANTLLSNDKTANNLALVSGIVALIGVIVGFIVAVYQTRKTAKQTQEQYWNSMEILEATSSLNAKADENQNKRQLELEKQQIEIEKQQLELERQQESLAWQKEAIDLIDVSPQAAIFIAWSGLERDIRRVAQDLYVLSQSPNIQEKGDKNIESYIAILYENVKIGRGTKMMLEEMTDLRNKIANGKLEENVTSDIARDFVVKAVGIDSLLSFKPSIPSP